MKKSKNSFYVNMQKYAFITNIPAIILLFLYSIFITNMKITLHWQFLLGTLGVVTIFSFIFSPLTNYLITGKISKLVKQWENGELDKAQRTELFKKIHKVPLKKQIESFWYFFAITIMFGLDYKYLLHLCTPLNIANFIACFFVSYLASLMAQALAVRICSFYEEGLVEDGIDESIIDEKKHFGYSYNAQFILYCIVPVIWGSFIFISVFTVYYYYNVPSELGFEPSGMFPGITKYQLKKMAVILIINAIAGILLVAAFLMSILKASSKLQNAMTHIIKNDVFTVKLTATDYADEVSYNVSLVNKMVLMFRSILDDIRKIGSTMGEPVAELSEISQVTASSSLEQSTGVKEILTTMEETDAQTRSIVDKINDVTTVAEETSNNVESGFQTLQQNLDQMNEITEANVTTIAGIKELVEKIGSIWDIVKIINDIADQTRIIAFSAELEASCTGENGKNFHIVANEVRRLATGITNSVEQIKNRITEIQHSSDNLIITSENGTERIREGQELSEKLKEKFTDIRKSSEITVESANQIKEIIYQESAAFDQIVSTVRQISAGIENFSSSTGTVNDTVQKLQNAANRLENLHSQIVE
ncbi:MAG: methyl-accepting chemotaxis protein [Treponemataceae bacterium]|nr:methyl-accepting chemotaxis protein [Treponemataceae bacterium]